MEKSNAKRSRMGTRRYSPDLMKEHDAVLEIANQAYALQDHAQCISYARRAVKIIPSSRAMDLLYRVHLDMGMTKRAMEYRFVQAMMERTELDLWEELLAYYRSLKDEMNPLETSRLIVCILKRILVIYASPEWGGPRGEKADEFLHLSLYQASMVTQIGEGSRAVKLYARLLDFFPYQIEAYAEFATLMYRLGNPPKAIQFLDDYVTNVKVQDSCEGRDGNKPIRGGLSVPPTALPSHMLHIASIRAEIQNETGKFVEAIAGIESLISTHGFSLFTTPTLYARWLVAKVLLANANWQTFTDTLHSCMHKTPRQSLLDSVDLLYDTANIFLRCNAPSLARIIFAKLIEEIGAGPGGEVAAESLERPTEGSVKTSDAPILAALHLGLACCHRDLHNTEKVEEYLRKVLDYEPFHVDTLCMLAEHHINRCYADAHGVRRAEIDAIEQNRSKIIDLLTPKPETDAVLSLRLLNQRAKFYVFHDKTNDHRRSLALTDLLEIVNAAMRDTSASTVVGGILNPDGGKVRKRPGETSINLLYPSSTLTMTQVTDGSVIGTKSFLTSMTSPKKNSKDFLLSVEGVRDMDSASMASQSIASTFNWESRPSDRPTESKAQRFHTDSIRSSYGKFVTSGNQSRAPSSIFQHGPKRTRVRKTGHQAEDIEENDIFSTAGSVGNLDELDIFDQLFSEEIGEKIESLDENAPQVTTQPNLHQSVKVVLHWVDVQIALQSEEEILSTFLLFVSLLVDASERFYWLSNFCVARRILKPVLRQKIELELFNASIQIGNENAMGEQLSRLLRFQTDTAYGKSFVSADFAVENHGTFTAIWNALNDLFKHSVIPSMVLRLRRTFLMRFRSKEKALCHKQAETPLVNTTHRDRVFPFLILLGNLNASGMLRASGRWALMSYYRALSMNPNATLPLLCLAVFHARICRHRQLLKRFEKSWRACWHFSVEHRKQMEKEKGVLGWLEGTYNMGRLAQYVGIPHIAVQCYKNVLRSEAVRTAEWDQVVKNDAIDADKAVTLRHNTAYNLHTIYRSSGNLDLAFAVLMQHVRV